MRWSFPADKSSPELDESAKTMLVLDRFPEVIRAFAPVAGAVTAPLGNIDKLVMVGGGGGEGSSPLHRLAGVGPATIFNLVQSAQALGLDVNALLGKLGVKREREGLARIVATLRELHPGAVVEACFAAKGATARSSSRAKRRGRR